MTAPRWITLGVFVVVMSMILGSLVIIFGNFRFDAANTYRAQFRDVSGLHAGQFVRVAGVEVGTVDSVEITGEQSAQVTFAIDDSYRPTRSTTAIVRYLNLTGDRYLELRDGTGDLQPLPADGVIPLERTSPALDLDTLLGSFRPLLQAIEPGQVNQFSAELLSVLQGQGGTVASLLARTASLTQALAQRDQVIGSLITNLNTVLATVAARQDQFDTAITAATQLAGALALDTDRWGSSLTAIDAAAGSLGSLLTDTREPIAQSVTQLRRAADQVNAGSATLDSVLSRLPDTYQSLTRLGAYGNFFNYYLCGLRLKLTGPDGKDLTLPLIGQSTGRCAPK